jgi:hypothetical protein
MQPDVHQNGELTQTAPWLRSNTSELRATMAELMLSPGVRSVSYQEPRGQLLVRFDAAVTDVRAIRRHALGSHVMSVDNGADAMRWAPTAGKLLLHLATAALR